MQARMQQVSMTMYSLQSRFGCVCRWLRYQQQLSYDTSRLLQSHTSYAGVCTLGLTLVCVISITDSIRQLLNYYLSDSGRDCELQLRL